MKTPEEILTKRGITKDTKFHAYDYLYKTVIKTHEEYAEQFKFITKDNNSPNKELFAPFDIALTLKQKGFDEVCYGVYEFTAKGNVFTDDIQRIRNSNITLDTQYAAPLYQQVVDFLETKGVHFSKYWYDDRVTPTRWCYSINIKDVTMHPSLYLGSDVWEAIRKALTYLEQGMKSKQLINKEAIDNTSFVCKDPDCIHCAYDEHLAEEDEINEENEKQNT